MREWVKFHRELTRGAKRGIKRAYRFVYLELSLEARARLGVIELPFDMPLADAVADLLGGDRREIQEALKALMAGPEPMVEVCEVGGIRTLSVVQWAKWNEAPGGSTERVQRHREKQRNGDVTRYTVTPGTVPETVGNALVTPSEERREEEKRRDQIPSVSLPAVPTVTADAAVAAPGPVGPDTKPKRGRPKMGKTACPSSDDPNVAEWLDEHALPALSSKFGADVAKMLDWHRSNGKMMADWAATWRNWARSERAPHPVGPADGHAPKVTERDEPKPPPPLFPVPANFDPNDTITDLSKLVRFASGQ